MSNRMQRGLWTNRDMRKEELVSTIAGKLEGMYLAELVQVADFIRGIEIAREFCSR